MFTLKSLMRSLKNVRDSDNMACFSRKKSKLAYRLSRMSSQYRGRVIEDMVKEYYLSKKRSVWYYGGSHPFDMRVDGKRIEVKSALARNNTNGNSKYTYNFQHIKPHNFDKLILVFIAPEGIKTRVVDSRTVAKQMGSRKKHKALYVGKKDSKPIGKAVSA